MMEVTNVRIKKVGNGAILGFADITFDHVFTSKGWKIWPGRDGRRYDLGFPSEPDKNGKTNPETGKLQYWYTSFVDKKQEKGQELMDHICEQVFAEYERDQKNDDEPDW